MASGNTGCIFLFSSFHYTPINCNNSSLARERQGSLILARGVAKGGNGKSYNENLNINGARHWSNKYGDASDAKYEMTII